MKATQADLETLASLAPRERLDPWLADNVRELGDGPLIINFLHGGTSNTVFTVSRGGSQGVLRRTPLTPPPWQRQEHNARGAGPESAAAVGCTASACLCSCDDPSVIGSPFFVMERVKGWAPGLTEGDTVNMAPFDCLPYKYGVPFAMVDALVRLARIDYKAIGHADFGRPDRFLDRQVDRWLSQLDSDPELYDYPGRRIPGFDYVTDWLRANQPNSFVPGIMHGDVGLPNALFAPGPPAQVTALIDWELATIGDPLLDLGGFVHSMCDEREPCRVPQHGSLRVDDYPTRQALAPYYAAGTGADPAALDYYMVLATYECLHRGIQGAQAAIGLLPASSGCFFSGLGLRRVAEAQRIARLVEGLPVPD
ncbi:phosphotransferase family protein [Sphingobium sp. SCG-1]|uniref:phosphotransferase family protein n=1 Tax=Sphingobium sp. SCG-1 TaxID=2072936 RepID=UPI000CD695AE|nr:phosphotransferase family protein [Sphingobium sp. SCG-1]AUW57151.1 phosphotransferase family protein [Sphingobium sp. SCG-1]